jgi:hypothetical protein
VQGPAHLVHNDYTLTSAPLRLKLLSEPAKINDAWKPLRGPGEPLISPEELEHLLRTSRYAFINVWRNISEAVVRDQPLAMVAASDISPEDLIVLELKYADRTGENYLAHWNAKHRWYYYPDMSRDEVLVLKVWDSAGAFHVEHLGANEYTSEHKHELAGAATSQTVPATFSLHSAFADPSTPTDYEKRQSIEIRTVVFF